MAKGRFLLRALCRSFEGYSRITCAVTDQAACLDYWVADAEDPNELLVRTHFPENANGSDLAKQALELQPQLLAVILALGDAIPVECIENPWLEAVAAGADFVGNQQLLKTAVMAMLGGPYYRSSTLRKETLACLSCPRLSPWKRKCSIYWPGAITTVRAPSLLS